jgi:molecular chaperone GrpE
MSIEEQEPIGPSAGEETQPARETDTPEAEIAQLRQQLESKEQEIKAQQDKYLRLYAEFENYKKRAARDQEEFSKYANERLLKELLPVVDNLERAIAHTRKGSLQVSPGAAAGAGGIGGATAPHGLPGHTNIKDPGKFLEGLGLILKQCLDVMGKFGVTGFESHLQPFDPTKHQAIGQVESEEHEDGTVIEEIQKGYRLNDRILRPALVMVSKKKNDEGITAPPQDPSNEK